MKDIKIESLNIKLGDRYVELSIEEAEQLHYALGKIFNKTPIQTPDYTPYKEYWRDNWWATSGNTNNYSHTIFCSNELDISAQIK